jgi:hypothetical protein
MHAAKNILESFEPGPLPGKGNLLDHVFPDEPGCALDISLGNHFFGKAANDACILFCQLELSLG